MPITFPPVATKDVSDDPLIIEAKVKGYWVRRVFVYKGAAVQVMFEHYFDNLSPAIKARLTPTHIELVSFSSEQLILIKKVELGGKFKEGDLFRKTMLKFTVVRASSPYNIILGKMGMRELRDVSFTTVKHDEKIGVMKLKEVEESGEEKVLVNPTFLEQTVTTDTQLSAKCQGRVLGSEKSRAVIKEVEEWVKAEIVRQVKYPTWISNPVLVKKVDDTWRMSIDFKNLNSACPKDYYPFLEIDLKVEAGTYCYTKMPFGLKNAWATYQRLVDSAFQEQLDRNLDAYIDDMVIKSKTKQGMMMDIVEIFDNLRKINMKLNPKKCSFGIREGKLLGYMVTSEGIRANPKKTKAVADMQALKTLKDMHKRRPGSGSKREADTNPVYYEALLVDLRIAHKIKVWALKVKVDSKLVACQMNGEFLARSDGMAKYLTKAKEHETLFKRFSIENIPRNQNHMADVPSKLASVAFNHLTKEIVVEVLNAKSVDTQEVNTIVEEEDDNWMTPIINFLEWGI
nr:hypothetical protein [Tanacetum cinerariifolium]